MTNPLAKLDKATHMLAEAKTLDEIKNIMDVAEAARTYARAAKLGLQAYNHAAESKVRAERKAGEFLKRLERKPEGRPSKLFHNGIVSEYSDVLKENAIPTTSAYRWQQTKPTLAVGFLLDGLRIYGDTCKRQKRRGLLINSLEKRDAQSSNSRTLGDGGIGRRNGLKIRR